jgi:hypothetical protein
MLRAERWATRGSDRCVCSSCCRSATGRQEACGKVDILVRSRSAIHVQLHSTILQRCDAEHQQRLQTQACRAQRARISCMQWPWGKRESWRDAECPSWCGRRSRGDGWRRSRGRRFCAPSAHQRHRTAAIRHDLQRTHRGSLLRTVQLTEGKRSERSGSVAPSGATGQR